MSALCLSTYDTSNVIAGIVSNAKHYWCALPSGHQGRHRDVGRPVTWDRLTEAEIADGLEQLRNLTDATNA